MTPPADSVGQRLRLFLSGALVRGGVLVALLAGQPVFGAEGGLDLVREGEPVAEIVVEKNSPKAAHAAEQIQKYLQKISGAKLPIVVEGTPAGLSTRIYVGRTQAAERAGLKIPSGFDPAVRPDAFSEEGFVIRTLGGHLYIGGNNDGPYQGTIFGAFEFLERLGCRFFFPGEWGEVIPRETTIRVPELNVTSRPDFPLRNTSLGGWFPPTPEERQIFADWEQKIKNTPTGESFYPLVGDGFLGYLLPPQEYFADHPDLYATDKSGNAKPPMDFLNGVMLSLHNPKVFDLAVDNLEKALAGKSQGAIQRIISKNGFGISPPDGASFDYDPVAVSQNQNFFYPNYVEHPMTSEEYFGFAAKLARRFPNFWVSTMAYSGRELPPQGVAIPENLAVLYAPIATCVLHPLGDPTCWRKTETLLIMQQWCKACHHVYLYDYNPGLLLGSFVPEADAATFPINAREYQKMGLKGFQTEGRKAFMITWLSYYVRSRFMWDANADIEAIKNDFYTKFFGPEAGPLVRKWWDRCEEQLTRSAMHVHEDWLLDHVYSPEFVAGIRPLVEQAARCRMDEAQRKRFEAFRLIANHLEAFAARNAAEENLDYAKALEEGKKMEAAVKQLHETYSFFIGLKEHPDFNNGWMKRYEKFVARTDGREGTLVAKLPLEAAFRIDRFNEGIIHQWYQPGFLAKGWDVLNTFQTWEAQRPAEDAAGHDYDGYGWYRFEIDVAKEDTQKPLRLFLGGVINEAWVWVNGEYAGHRPWKSWWAGREPLEMECDITGKLKPGKNLITIRVLNSADVGGWIRRGFVWSPKEAPVTTDRP